MTPLKRPFGRSSPSDDLRKHNQELLAVVNELSTRFAAVNFKSYEMAEEIRSLGIRLSGTEASSRCLKWENRQLRDEIRFLRKLLLEFADPPEAIRELIAAYRSEMEDREQVPEDDGRKRLFPRPRSLVLRFINTVSHRSAFAKASADRPP